jgi:hypothetical protein
VNRDPKAIAKEVLAADPTAPYLDLDAEVEREALGVERSWLYQVETLLLHHTDGAPGTYTVAELPPKLVRNGLWTVTKRKMASRLARIAARYPTVTVVPKEPPEWARPGEKLPVRLRASVAEFDQARDMAREARAWLYRLLCVTRSELSRGGR